MMLRISPGNERNGDCVGLVMFGIFWRRGADVKNVAISFIEYLSIPSADHLRWKSEPVIRGFFGGGGLTVHRRRTVQKA